MSKVKEAMAKLIALKHSSAIDSIPVREDRISVYTRMNDILVLLQAEEIKEDLDWKPS